MKRLILINTIILSTALGAFSQKNLNAEFGLLLNRVENPGFNATIDFETSHSDAFSLKSKFETGFIIGQDYNSLSFALSRGFVKYFNSGFAVEQSIGIGTMANFYKVESIWYFDAYGNVTRYKDGSNWGLMPVISMGIGYDLTKKKDTRNIIWLKPSAYWNFGFGGINLPYFNLQLSYSFNLKSF